MNKDFRIKNKISEESLHINYENIQIFIDQDVLNLCKLPKGLMDTILSFIDSKRDEKIYQKRITNLINFFKSVINFTLSSFEKRNFNLDKIKKTFQYIHITLPDEGDEDTAAKYSKYNHSITILIHDLNFTYNFIKPEFLDKPGLEPKDYDSTVSYYSANLIHEIGHAIHLNYLTTDAFDYWLEGWQNPYEISLKIKNTDPYDFKKDNNIVKIRDEFEKDSKFLYKLKKENISSKLINFQKRLQQLINQDNSIEKNEFLKELDFPTIEELNKIQDNIKTHDDAQIWLSKYDMIYENIQHRNKIKKYLINCFKKLKSNEDVEILNFFELKDFNILSLQIENKTGDILDTGGLLYILGLYSPSILLIHLQNLMNKTIDNNYQLFFNAISQYSITTPQQLQDFLTNGIIKDYFAQNYSPESRNNFKATDSDLSSIRNKNFIGAVDHLKIPTNYGQTNHKEDFAETFFYFILYPEFLSDIALFRIKKTLWISGFSGKKIQEKLLRKAIQLLIENFRKRKSRPTSRFI